VVAHTDDGEFVGSSAPEKGHVKKENLMNVESEEEDDLRPEYDFSQMKGGVRGKYVQRYGLNELLGAGLRHAHLL
jgi:hypothetical protein